MRYFGKGKCTLHVTDFSSKRAGDWTEDKFCHTLASSRELYLNFGTLGGILLGRG
jgi:hypothetical protein